MAARDAEFAEYFAARFDPMRRAAFVLCGDWVEAEELAQAAFVRVYARWRTVHRESADAYLRTTLTRLFLDGRRRGRAREHLVPAPPSDAGAIPACDDIAALRQPLLAALLRVPPRQRAVLVLRFLQDLSVDQVAVVLRCSAGTVKSQTSKGLDALRAAYRAETNEPDDAQLTG